MGGFATILQAVLPAAGNIVAGVLANRAQAGGLSNAQGNLQQAYNLGTGAINNAVAGSIPYANWALGQGNSLNNWNYGQGMNNLNWGFDQSRNALASGMNNATNVMNQGFNAGMSFLTPYSQLGSNALSAVQSHVFGTPRTTPATVTAPRFNLPQVGMNALQRPPQTPPPNMSPVPQYNALTGAAGSFGPQLTDNWVKQPGVGTKIAGYAAGGLVFGPLVSSIIGHFTRKGREKEAASGAVNELSDWIWKQAVPAYKSGQITLDQLKGAVKAGWDSYDNWMKGTLQDEGVIHNSEQSQLKYLNDSLQREFGFTI